MYVKITFIKIFIAVAFFLMPSIIWASGGTPADPLILRIGEGLREIPIENPGDVVWVRAEFTASVDFSHVAFRTIGEYDTYMYFYKNLEDAQADKYLEEDDDSGDGSNAKISYSIGYPSPYYLKLRMYSGSVSGTFNLDSEMYYEEPQYCPSAGPCAMVAASKGRSNAAQILFIMRNIKNNLLTKTNLGRKAIHLYYAISKDITWDLLSDLGFSRKLYSSALGLRPMMEEILRVSLNEGTGMVLSNDMVVKITELKDMLRGKVSQENAGNLEASFKSLNFTQNIGKPIKSVLLQSGFIPSSDRYSFTLDKNRRFLASKFEIIVKFRQSPPEMPQVVSDRLITGMPSVDQIFLAYSVESIHQIFNNIKHKKSNSGLERIFKIRLREQVSLD